MCKVNNPIAPYDAKIQQDISLFSGHWQEAKYGLYESDRVNLLGYDVKIIAHRIPTRMDKKLGDTILQQFVINNKHTTDEGEYTSKPVKFDAKKGSIVSTKYEVFFREFGIEDSSKNRLALKASLDNLRSLTVIGFNGANTFDYTIFSAREFDSDKDVLTIEISQLFMRRFFDNQLRFQRLDRIRLAEDKVKSAGELAKYLVARGAGSDKLPISKVSKKDIFRHQGLSFNNKTDQNVINRQLQAIAEIWDVTYKNLERGNYIKFSSNGYFNTDKEEIHTTTFEAADADIPTEADLIDADTKEDFKLNIYLGSSGTYYSLLSDGNTIELPKGIDTSLYNIVLNPYLFNSDGTEKIFSDDF